MTHQAAAILVTRPLRQAERFAQTCRARFGDAAEIVLSPLIEIAFLAAQAPITNYDGLVFTSENGVIGFRRRWPHLKRPAFCVGDRTARAARQAGLEAHSAKGAAADLILRISNAAPAGRLLHLRGEHARGDVAARLRAAGLKVDERVIYRQIPRGLSDAARMLMAGKRRVILPLFSPRSASLFAGQAENRPANLCIVAMSAAVADRIQGSNLGEIVILPHPTAEEMLRGIAGFIDA